MQEINLLLNICQTIFNKKANNEQPTQQEKIILKTRLIKVLNDLEDVKVKQ